MGLLAYNPYDPRLRYLEGGAIAPAPSPAPAPVARPRPQAPAAPQLPSLTAPMNGLPMGPDPFAPPPVAPPVRAMPQAPQAPQQQPNRWASAWQGLTGQAGLAPNASFADRFNASAESPLMGLGLSMLAASAPGAGPDTFANSFNAFNQQRTERERARRQDARQATQDERANTLFGWQTEERQREQAARDRRRGWAQNQTDNPLAAVDPDVAFEAAAEAAAIAGQPITPYQQAQLDLQQEQLRIERARAAQEASRYDTERPLRGADRELMENVRDAAGRSQALTMLGEEFLAANGVAPTGELSRFNPMNIWSPERRAMTSASSQMRAYMRPPGSGATSDYEQRIYAMGVPSTDNTGPQNQAIMRYHQAAAQLAQARRFFYEDYAARRGSLNGAEQAFQNSDSFRAITREAPLPQQSGGGGQQQSAGTPAPSGGRSSFETLPPPSQFREGQRIRDSQTNREFEIRGGRWVPVRGDQLNPVNRDGVLR